MQIPYTVETRPDTGLYNAKLGIWLFLASEVMLFAGLFSSYILLRTGSVAWPRHMLPVGLATLNTAILIASSMTMVMAWAALRMNNELEQVFMGFQFQDRLTQMLDIVGRDMARFADWVQTNPAATQADVAEWLAALERTYTMEEQRTFHHGTVKIEHSANVEFF